MAHRRWVAALIFVALLISSTSYADAIAPTLSQKSTIGGLSCFSIVPPKLAATAKYEDYPTCDSLCAKQQASCTGMENGGMNPPVTCSDPTPPNFAICRCCSVKP